MPQVKWFRRRRRPKFRPFDPAELPEPKRATFEESVGEGLMLAEYASRMRLRNRIVMGALGAAEQYEAEHYLPDGRQVLDAMAAEQRSAARRLRREIDTTEHMYGSAEHAHDYQSADSKNLRRREAVALKMAERLAERRDDDDYLLGLVEDARVDAWHDVSRAVEESLDRSNFVVDERYDEEREGRVRGLIDEDLARLVKEHQ